MADALEERVWGGSDAALVGRKAKTKFSGMLGKLPRALLNRSGVAIFFKNVISCHLKGLE